MTRRHARPRSVTSHGGGGLGRHRRLALGAAVAVSIGLTAVGVAGAARRQPAPSEAERQIRGEIDAMLDSGVPEDDPKVALLEDQVEELRRGNRSNPPREPGIDLARRVADAKASAGVAGRATTAGVPTGPAWQSGTVECEPVPGILTADEVAGATCLSVPQPDRSTLYVAVGRDGIVRTVAFGPAGNVGRGPNRTVPGGVAPGATAVLPTASGDIRVTVEGRAPVTVDVG
ncbi:MAG TPA: hypothetical protein VFG94_09680 [Acidimicrobiales bacterium]|nr:hypothetical protein [Acidimicrobiales bacterium]